MAEQDPWLRRIERNTFVACVGLAVLAWIVGDGRLGPPLGVLAGGALMAMSYWGIKGGVDAALGHHRRVTGRLRRFWRLVKFFTRYAILSAAGYVIIARLSLPPAAVMLGASSLLLAVAAEAGWRRQSGRTQAR